jgi:ABC-type uncharacterized transport system involved in gliding motility auxiliary subunit
MVWSRSAIAAASIALAFVLFFAVNVFFNAAFKTARIDLTAQGAYTISAGTVSTLRSMPEPVTLRLFFSESIATPYPTILSYGQRVRDLLQQFSYISGGKLKVEVVDPVPFSEAEDQAIAAGIRGAPIATGERIYFGLSGSNSIDGRETIPVFLADREKFLEYDLTSLVYRLIREKKPQIGIVSNLPLDTGLGGMEAAMQGQSQPFFIYEQLRQDYETRFLEQDFDRIPADIDVLMIAHPKELNARTLYAIDQFVMRGGRVLAFLDPLSELSGITGPQGQPLPGATQNSAASLGKVLESWGVAVDAKFLIGDQSMAQRVRTQSGDGAADYILWLAIPNRNLDQKDRVTATLTNLNLGTVGIVSPLDKRTTTVTPIIWSTFNAMQVSTDKANANPNPEELNKAFLPTKERYTIGARISGPVKSAFPDGPPKESLTPPAVSEGAPKPEPLPAHLKETKGPANIVLLADSDIFNDSFWVELQQIAGERMAARQIAGNMAFVMNAIEDLSGSNDLISLRSRGETLRPFTTVDDIRRRAEARLLREKDVLEAKLNEAANRLAELQGQRPDQANPAGGNEALTFTAEQQAEIEKFRQEYNQTRRALNSVQLRMNQDIDRLKGWLAAFNIAFVPITMLAGLLVWSWMRARKRADLAAAKAAGASA